MKPYDMWKQQIVANPEKLGLDAEDKQDSPLETFEESSFDSDDSMRETLDLNKDQ